LRRRQTCAFRPFPCLARIAVLSRFRLWVTRPVACSPYTLSLMVSRSLLTAFPCPSTSDVRCPRADSRWGRRGRTSGTPIPAIAKYPCRSVLFRGTLNYPDSAASVCMRGAAEVVAAKNRHSM
jgi:hypothetical protein